MFSYLFFNSLMFLMVVIANGFLYSAPARLKFYLCIIGMLTWLIPWPLFDTFIFDSLSEPLLTNSFGNITLLAQQLIDYLLAIESLLFFATLLGLIIGVVLFAIDVLTHRKLCRSWEAGSVELNHSDLKQFQIRQFLTEKNHSPGMISGLTKPIIWLDKKIQSPQLREIILYHEATHLKQHDHLWIWFIGFYRKLFWWNPFVGMLANQAVYNMELSCDEKCKRYFHGDHYVNCMMKIIKTHTYFSSADKLMIGVAKHKKFNVYRIEQLLKDKKLLLRHYGVIFCLTIALMVTSLGAINSMAMEYKNILNKSKSVNYTISLVTGC